MGFSNTPTNQYNQFTDIRGMQYQVPQSPPEQDSSYSIPAYTEPVSVSVVSPDVAFSPTVTNPSQYLIYSSTTAYVYNGPSSLGQPLPASPVPESSYLNTQQAYPQQGYQIPAYQAPQQTYQSPSSSVSVSFSTPTTTYSSIPSSAATSDKNPFTGAVVIPNSSVVGAAHVSTCPKCKGKGTVHEDAIHECNEGGLGQCQFCQKCKICSGRGTIDGNIEICHKCQGLGKYHATNSHQHEPGCIYCTKCEECSEKGYILKPEATNVSATPSTHAETFPGFYTIVNSMTRMAIDGNVNAAKQQAATHPKPWMCYPNPNAKNHQWAIQSVEKDYYIIVLRDTSLCLDGNSDLSIPQSDPRHPAPFLWAKQVNAPNHHWRVQKVGPDSYSLINRHNNLVLDGSTYVGAAQWDSAHPTPFLGPPAAYSPSQQWILHRVA